MYNKIGERREQCLVWATRMAKSIVAEGLQKAKCLIQLLSTIVYRVSTLEERSFWYSTTLVSLYMLSTCSSIPSESSDQQYCPQNAFSELPARALQTCQRLERMNSGGFFDFGESRKKSKCTLQAHYTVMITGTLLSNGKFSLSGISIRLPFLCL